MHENDDFDQEKCERGAKLWWWMSLDAIVMVTLWSSTGEEMVILAWLLDVNGDERDENTDLDAAHQKFVDEDGVGVNGL